MAGDWIKIRHDLRDDPACLTLSDKMSDSLPTVFGRLYLFWSWADRHTTDGDLGAVGKSHIDHITDKQGFADALLEIGWLEATENGLRLPEFSRHNGSSSKARALEAEAKRLRRSSTNTVSDKRPTSSDKTSDQRREEEKRLKKTKQKKVSGFDPKKLDLPPSLDRESFVKAWQAWCDHRCEIKKPLTRASVDRQIRQLANWGAERAVRAIDHTITQGWQGMREPDHFQQVHNVDDAPLPQPAPRWGNL